MLSISCFYLVPAPEHLHAPNRLFSAVTVLDLSITTRDQGRKGPTKEEGRIIQTTFAPVTRSWGCSARCKNEKNKINVHWLLSIDIIKKMGFFLLSALCNAKKGWLPKSGKASDPRLVASNDLHHPNLIPCPTEQFLLLQEYEQKLCVASPKFFLLCSVKLKMLIN